MGEQFGQRYPNGVPSHAAALRLNTQTGYGPPKSSGLTNGQPYMAPNSQAPVPASFPNPAFTHQHHQQPISSPPTSSYPGQQHYSQPPPLGPPPNQSNFNGAVGQPKLSARPAMPNYGNTINRNVPPPMSYTNQVPNVQQPLAGLVQGMDRMSVTQQGFNKLWGTENVDLMQCRNILPPHKITPPAIRLPHEFMNTVNCSHEIFCCTMNKIPETDSLLQKSRLPLGVLIHPFKDLLELPVIQCSGIVRCRSCRTYINPFVYFVDTKRWKCNLCFRVNELPDEFQYDPVSRTYGDPSRRPEIKNCTIEYIAPAEYMLRPPQPAIYLYILDVSRWGCDSGYLRAFCDILADELEGIPGDSRTQIGFILVDSYLHYFSIPDGSSQAKELIITDVDDVFLPMPDSLLVNLAENEAAIRDLLTQLPQHFAESYDIGCAMGPALQAAYKLMSSTGGRITVMQCSLPNRGPGSLVPRESSGDSDKDAEKLKPQTDFYKRLALDCSTQQIAVDLFLLNSQYADLATVAGISLFSGGCIHHFPQYRYENVEISERFGQTLRRYLIRKIGFEAVMRIRCSRGLAIHTFHGNFFVRSTDLLSLPNVNPDAGYGMQISIEGSLSELHSVCFQAALLYTSAKGERRIRVHTVCLPVSSNLKDILTSANQQAIIGLLAKMAVDRSLTSNLSYAREAFINASIDILSAYKLADGMHGGLMAPTNLALIPLYILALLKSVAFRSGTNIRLDDRMFNMLQMKNLPLRELIQNIHPDLYHVTTLEEDESESESRKIVIPGRLGLSLQFIDSRGAYLLDTPDCLYLLIGEQVSGSFLQDVLGVSDARALGSDINELPVIETPANQRLRAFIKTLQLEKLCPAVLRIFTQQRQYAQLMINDKTENAFSYHELLNHIKSQMK